MANIITEYPQFFTATILEWKKLLEADRYKDIVIDSMRFLVNDTRVIVYGFVIMINHMHIIWQMQAAIKRSYLQRDFLKFTAQKIEREMKPGGLSLNALTPDDEPMIKEHDFIRMALSFPGAEQAPHFNRIGFKVAARRMFATYLPDDNTANVFLRPEEQILFCEIDPKNIYPVPNKWGAKGATTFRLDGVAREIIREALLSAYNDILTPRK